MTIFVASVLFAHSQNASLKGIVLSSENKEPVPGADVQAGAQNTVKTGDYGDFTITGLTAGRVTLIIRHGSFTLYSVAIDVKEGANDLGTIYMQPGVTPDSDENESINVVSLSSMDFEDENKGQNTGAVLHSSNDVFNSSASFVFSAMRFRPRGYDADLSTVYMNGIPVNDPESGFPSWSEWGGLNEVMRNKEGYAGLEPSGFSFGNIGGSTNIITRASLYRKQKKVTYSLTNRSYRQRIMGTYSTGLMENGWAFTVSASRRWAEEGYVEGTFYDAYSYFVAAERKINAHHSLNLTIFGAPAKRGMQGGSTQEVYDLVDNVYYNPNWGLQNGEKRNAKVRDIHEPRAILSHYFTISDKTDLTTSASFMYGSYKTSSLNWYDAADPRPDYYRYLPSYQYEQPAIMQLVTDNWLNDPEMSQINWEEMYQVNYLSNGEGKQAKYILEDKHSDQMQIDLTSVINHRINDKLKINGGLELSSYTGSHYKTINDLLGGNYWVDIDQFAERDFIGDSTSLQNDLNDPNRQVTVGDRYGYDYEIHQTKASLWGSATYTLPKLDVYAAASGNFMSFYREGNMMNGRHPENSFGKSEVQDFINYGVKAGATYKITGRQYVSINAAYLTKPPKPGTSYLSPKVKDDLLPDLTSETIMSGDLSYMVRYPKFNARLSVYQTYMEDQTELNSFYHDVYRTYVNYLMKGINKSLHGIEFGSEYKVTPEFSVLAAGAYGEYLYTSRPEATISVENSSVNDTTETVYIKNFFIPGTPQLAGTIGLKYFTKKFWFFNLNFNYYDKSYLDFNPGRRTERAIYMLGPGDTAIANITEPLKLDGGYTIDFSVGKSIRYKNYFISINLTINNLLDNQELVSGGYEQMRFDYEFKRIEKFPPKFFYAYGRNYFLNVAVRF